MLEALISTDQQLMLTLNGPLGAGMDTVMWYASKTWPWLPLYGCLVFLLWKKYEKKVWLPLMAVAALVTVSDRVSSGMVKPMTERPRPSHEPALEGEVYIINNYKGGQYGFYSSHASNTMAVAVFMVFALGLPLRWMMPMLLWPVVVGYSRIYLGVHYPADVLVGWLAGALMGWGMWWWIKIFTDKK